MKLRLATWNVEGRLSENEADAPRSTPECIAREIIRLNADVVYVPEARRTDEVPSAIRTLFAAHGYEIFECLYDDAIREVREPDASRSSLFLSRVPTKKHTNCRYDEHRQLPVLTVEKDGTALTIAGVHLDDRSEKDRIVQAKAIVKKFRSTTPLVLMGDFNASHRTRQTALYRLRAIRMLAKCIPHSFLQSVVQRFLEMSDGKALQLLEDGLNVRDADRHHRPTVTPKMRGMEWMPSVPITQIDHIFLSAVLEAASVMVQKDAGSDHRAVVVEIEQN